MGYVEEGKSNIGFLCSDDKANVFLIGDSIRIGYCKVVEELLSEKAKVFYSDKNCRNTQYVITKLNRWRNKFDCPEKVNVVFINCGHWDIAHWCGADFSLTSKDEYAKNLGLIFELLNKLFVNAKIVFATTTPMNPQGIVGVNPRSNGEIDAYNRIAVEKCKEFGIDVVDLNAFSRDWDESYFADYCHFTPDAFAKLGAEVASKIENYI